MPQSDKKDLLNVYNIFNCVVFDFLSRHFVKLKIPVGEMSNLQDI